MKIAIVGAGVAGILSLKYALESGYECHCFEQTKTFGGTWVYTDETGNDEYGFPIYNTMYKDLKTNIPKEIMVFKDFAYRPNVLESSITSEQVLQYLTDYVDTFALRKYINCFQSVVKVHPEINNKWIVTSMNIKTKTEISNVYDFVFICNGHFCFPRVPAILKQDIYEGLQLHSKDYRTPKLYIDKRVLIIGGGFSGIDISNHIKHVTKKLFISHWSSVVVNIDNVTIKPSVAQFYKNGVIFADGTKEDFDIVMYCTGYEYKFPFLSKECGISVQDNWVHPLYKHVINIDHPTMFFIGIPFIASAFLVCDLQAQFAVAVIDEKFKVPSKSEMMKELNDYVAELKKKDVPLRHAHKLGFGQSHYLNDLAKAISLKNYPSVLCNIYDEFLKNLYFRKNLVLLDDKT
ncbi:hypothetical protein FQA39_LY08248 [Lamprigera yunnana]|nr:hypothetical protein FQA39_LY08248 [Lamprigera yunnana]